MPTVTFKNDKTTVEVPEGADLRKTALKHDVQLYQWIHKTFNCRGFRQCGSCAVKVVKGGENLSKKTLWEKLRLMSPILWFTRMASDKEVRLACRTKVLGDVEIETRPEMNYHGEKFWE